MIESGHGSGEEPAEGLTISKAEKSRLRRRLMSMRRHQAALDLALAEFSDREGTIDADAWDTAFISADPNDAKRVVTVTGCQSALINNYVEMLRAGARLTGLVSGRRPHTETVVEACRQVGVLTEKQANLVQEAYRVEGRVEHASPEVKPEEVRASVEALRAALPKLVEQFIDWLAGRGMNLTS